MNYNSRDVHYVGVYRGLTDSVRHVLYDVYDESKDTNVDHKRDNIRKGFIVEKRVWVVSYSASRSFRF